MRRTERFVWAIVIGMTASCGGAAGTSAPLPPGSSGSGSTSNSITVNDNFFSPNSTTVSTGTTVTWTWGGAVRHNVTFDDGAASPTQLAGGFTRTFSAAGTFKYHCTVHGTIMSGVITVQ